MEQIRYVWNLALIAIYNLFFCSVTSSLFEKLSRLAEKLSFFQLLPPHLGELLLSRCYLQRYKSETISMSRFSAGFGVFSDWPSWIFSFQRRASWRFHERYFIRLDWGVHQNRTSKASWR